MKGGIKSMSNEKKNSNELKHGERIDIAEINSNRKRVDFTLEASNTKPFDITLMTGTNSNNNEGSEEK